MDDKQRDEIQRQIKFQKLANEKKQMSVPLIEKRMAETFFPKELLSSRWRKLTKLALLQSMPMSQQSEIVDFANAVRAADDENSDITLSQFRVLSNSLDTVSPAMLNLGCAAYYDFIMEVNEMVTKWKSMIDAINDTVMKEVETTISARLNALDSTTGSFKGKNGASFKTIKGEA